MVGVMTLTSAMPTFAAPKQMTDGHEQNRNILRSYSVRKKICFNEILGKAQNKKCIF